MTATIDAAFWAGKRVFLTGHTGFKGSWLSLWLQSLGADVHGYALAPPTEPSLFAEARVNDGMQSVTGDLRDVEALRRAMEDARPEVVIHMAAQPLVRASYDDPIGTFATNVLGTVHLLDAAREVDGLRAVVSVTSDKAYENREWPWGYRETDAMGGHDPYSSSKGCAELVTSAYRRSFLSQRGVAVATARAGNVIGGGDWADNRLVPDVLRAFERGRPVVVRNPRAIRPWQHVLEPLSGYLVLAQRLHEDGPELGDAWNFGPLDSDARSVEWIVDHMTKSWGPDGAWEHDGGDDHPHEANYLKLDVSKARQQLQWEPRWSLEAALGKVLDWHRAWLAGTDARELTLGQVEDYNQTTIGRDG